MKYKILYTRLKAAQREITLMDFANAQMITLTADDLKNDEVDPQLHDFILINREKIKSGYWDYTY